MLARYNKPFELEIDGEVLAEQDDWAWGSDLIFSSENYQSNLSVHLLMKQDSTTFAQYQTPVGAKKVILREKT